MNEAAKVNDRANIAAYTSIPGRLTRRSLYVTGGIILALVMLPWYHLLGLRSTGPAAEQALRTGPLYTHSGWAGAVLGATAVLVLSSLIRGPWLVRTARDLGMRLGSLSAAQLGLACGLFAAGLSSWVNVVVLNGQPPLLDGIAQLIHARYLASGELVGPRLSDPAFWQFQFMLAGDTGWASQYPPGFAVALALADEVGGIRAMGPILLGLAVYLTSLVADRLFADDVIVARIAVILTAVSPILAFHAASYMNHVLALVLVLLAVLAALHCSTRSWAWSLVVGLAVGALFLTRPYTGVYYGLPAMFLMLGLAPGSPRQSLRDIALRITCAAAAAAPLLGALAAYNRFTFGHPMRFGYLAAEGPGHGLGFHVDPWGSPYGPVEALAYTSTDLAGLSLDLLQTPVPALGIVGVYLLLSPRPSFGLLVAVSLALIPVAAHVFYWHHDLFMGPRLLYEAIPWWCMLLAASMIGLIRKSPQLLRIPGGLVLFVRNGLIGTLFVAFALGALYASPEKLKTYGSALATEGQIASEIGGGPLRLVFVHTSWDDRLAARLAGEGMRLDSVRAALRQNSSCTLERYFESARGGGDSNTLSIDVAAGRNPLLREIRMPSGSVITTFDGEALGATCERQAQSDFDGVLALPPLVWQGDLPGLEARGPMFVRDLGPERNSRMLRQFPDREPKLMVRTREQEVRILPYADGMNALWVPNLDR